jgi:thiol-disulfide isomerase/thioredoxin
MSRTFKYICFDVEVGPDDIPELKMFARRALNRLRTASDEITEIDVPFVQDQRCVVSNDQEAQDAVRTLNDIISYNPGHSSQQIQEIDQSSFNGNSLKKEMCGEVGAIVLFYAPWCGHCQEFIPKYEEFLNVVPDGVNLYMYNCDKNRQYSNDTHGVKSFPTIYRYANSGKRGASFEGQRTQRNLLEFSNGIRDDLSRR